MIRARVALLVLAAASAPAMAAERCKGEAEVRALESRWLESYRTRDSAAMDEILARDFAITHADGSVEARKDVLDGLEKRRGTEGPSFFTSEVRARCRSGLVVLTGWVARRGDEERSRARYTDSWVREGRRWKVLSSHLSRPPRPGR